MDTNIAIDYIGGILPNKAVQWLDSVIDIEVAISVINKIEILGFETEKKEDMLPFEELVDVVHLLYVTDEVVNQTIIVAISIEKHRNLLISTEKTCASPPFGWVYRTYISSMSVTPPQLLRRFA